MKKVLIITTHFAPDIHVGAKRPTKFAKFLPRYGWQPIILTKKERYYHGIDETLNSELHPGLLVQRVAEWHILGKNDADLRNPIKDVSLINHNIHVAKGLASTLMSILDNLFFYDYSWLLPAFLTGLRLLKQQEINLIFSTSPNPEAHLIGLGLKIITQKKWVCEFRDPWRERFLFPKQFIQNMIHDYLHKSVLHRADCIITVGENLKEELIKHLDNGCREKIRVIYNGYDSDDFAKPIDGSEENKLTITYAGTWGYYRTPEYFLKAMGDLLRKRKEIIENIKIEFIGEVRFTSGMDSKIKGIIERGNLSKVVHILPSLPHKEVLTRLGKSHILLLVEGSVPNKPWINRKEVLTAKLFEYLYTRKPILALVPPNGEAARIIKETNAGEVVPPCDIKAIENKIYEMYQSFHKGNLVSSIEACKIEQFDRKKQTATLAGIFNNVLEGRRVKGK